MSTVHTSTNIASPRVLWTCLCCDRIAYSDSSLLKMADTVYCHNINPGFQMAPQVKVERSNVRGSVVASGPHVLTQH
jgi:hypothetical protein